MKPYWNRGLVALAGLALVAATGALVARAADHVLRKVGGAS